MVQISSTDQRVGMLGTVGPNTAFNNEQNNYREFHVGYNSTEDLYSEVKTITSHLHLT